LTDESSIFTENQFGIGTDIVEIQRFRNLDSDASFFSRVFSEEELSYCREYPDSAPHFASTFAGKEAVVKAMNSQIQLTVGEIEILRNLDGSPYVVLDSDFEVLVSLAHSDTYAVAIAMLIPKAQIENLEQFRKLLNENTQELLPR
jgi:holo-[acyl-carrier protein] synthase